jgi:hypothetical protein
MWEPQPLTTLRNSTACTGKTLPFYPKKHQGEENVPGVIIIQFNSIYLRANLTAQRPITMRARVEKK